MSGKLQLRLLGTPRITRDGVPLMGLALKTQALLAYLAVSGRPHARGALASLLWGEATEANARASLRKVVAELRRRVPSHVTITRDEVSFARGTPYWLDVEAFEQRANRALMLGRNPLRAEATAMLQEAVELYHGDFMDGFHVCGAPALEEWVLLEREHLRQLAILALEALVDHFVARRARAQALTDADRLLGVEPAHEGAHRCRMSLLAQGGQRAAALRQYQACRHALAALDAEPDGETVALYERICGGEPPPIASQAPAHSLPAPLTPLVGREAELAEMAACLHDPACRLLTLVGPGGSGKTRLALEAAADLQPVDLQPAGTGRIPRASRFNDGVCFVPLASLDAVESLLPTIAQALELSLPGREPPRQQLLGYLRRRRLLLVLDGFEHLLDGAGLLVDLLREAPGLKILVTSRARLKVKCEHLLRVGGLACREGVPGDPGALRTSPAVQLFLSSGRRVRSGFEPADADLEQIARICRWVGGLPLGILLAASWVGALTPAEIADQLSGDGGQGLDLLETDWRDVPARQRSMRAVFDHSWELLTEVEQAVLAGLSVFRGSFTLEAARQVTGGSLRQLLGLVDRSLLQRASSATLHAPAAGRTGERYEMHELLRQYAEEKLAASPDAAEGMHDRHSALFTCALERWWADLKGPRHQEALAEMGQENGNLRAAWDWAVERGRAARLQGVMDTLLYYCKLQGRYEEGERACRLVTERFSGQTARERRLLARALGGQGVFGHLMGRTEAAAGSMRQSLELLQELALGGEDTRAEQAFVLRQLGDVALETGVGGARQLYQQSLALYRSVGDDWGMANVLEALGSTATFSGDLGQALRAYEESLARHWEIGAQVGVYRSLALSIATAAYGGLAGKGRDWPQPGPARELHLAGLEIGTGRFAEAESRLARCLAAHERQGVGGCVDVLRLARAFNQMQLGWYEQARAETLALLDRYRGTGFQWGIQRSCCFLGFAALAAGGHADAQDWLQESITICREIRQHGHLGQALALSAVAAWGLGQLGQARDHLAEALRVGSAVRSYETPMFQMAVLCAASLLLSEEGQPERAVELYALASRHPLIAQSRLFEDVAGRHISAVAAALPPEVVAAAQARGRTRGLEATVVELLGEVAALPVGVVQPARSDPARARGRAPSSGYPRVG